MLHYPYAHSLHVHQFVQNFVCKRELKVLFCGDLKYFLPPLLYFLIFQQTMVLPTYENIYVTFKGCDCRQYGTPKKNGYVYNFKLFVYYFIIPVQRISPIHIDSKPGPEEILEIIPQENIFFVPGQATMSVVVGITLLGRLLEKKIRNNLELLH